jgi:preprotein translocase subunit SecE
MARTEVKLASRPGQRTIATGAPRRLPAVLQRAVDYLGEVWVELKRVDWPTRRELVSSTFVVVFVLLITAIYLGSFDYIFTILVKRWLLQQQP